MIINIHGGPEGQLRPTFLGGVNYYLNVLGVAVIFPNVRGSAGYGKTFLTLDNGERENSVKDIGALLDWIKAQAELDADRVMITGGSYGGYMTLACSVHFADRIRCTVDVVGISNFVTFLPHRALSPGPAPRRVRRRARPRDGRSSPRSPRSPTCEDQQTDDGRAGRNDPRVPLTEADQMVEP